MTEKCICGEPGRGHVIGHVYRVVLCNNCANEWYIFVSGLQAWMEFSLVSTQIEQATQDPQGSLKLLIKQHIDTQKRLYEIAKQWVIQRRAKR